MEKIYRVNIIYSVLLISAGIFGLLARYSEQGDWQYTSLIPTAFGLILLPMTNGIKKHNRTLSHLVLLLTLLMAVIVSVMLIINLNSGIGINRKMV
jgi:hypothetical protein